MKIRNVLIVGGGTAGWMTAAALTKLAPHIAVSLIESPNIPVSGVGESTLGQINEFFALLGITDDQWMKETGATYKTNIRFNDFRVKGESWDYPFGGAKDQVDSYHHGWMTWFTLNLLNPKKWHNGTFATSYNPVAHLAKYDKFTDKEDIWTPDTDSAYHIDAIKFAHWLKDNMCEGVSYMQGNVVKCGQDEFGSITWLKTDTKQTLTADLYVDCTGFQSLLLEQYMKVPFKSFHVSDGGCLINDTAVACHMPHEDKSKEITSTTNCTALNNGWVWDVPLWERSGVGYVHSKDFATEPDIELYKYLVKTRGQKRADEARFRTIPFKNGKHEKSWVRNVVAVGLSNCFVEPLEATGLLTTHEQITRICTTLSSRNGHVNSTDIDMVNLCADLEIEGFKNFIALHYAYSIRETDYWNFVSDEISYDFSTGLLDNIFTRMTSERHIAYEWIGDPSHNDGPRYVSAGMGFNPLTHHTLKLKRLEGNLTERNHLDYLKDDEDKIDEWNKFMYNYCSTLQTSYEYQRDKIYAI